MEYLNCYQMACNYDPLGLTLPEGNYTGANLASGIQDLLNGFAVTFGFEVLYHPARGTTTIEAKPEGLDSHNKFHIPSDFGIMTWMGGTDSPVLTLPEGNYTGANLASGIQDLLNGFAVTFGFEVLYHPARGTITIEAKPEGLDSHNKFHIPSDFGIMTWMGSTDSDYPWKDSQGNITTVEINSPQSINGVLRNSDMITMNLESEYYRTYEGGFIDLLNVHNVYLHCPNLGKFNNIGVRGENTN